MDLSATSSVLVIKPSSLGDVVHALPAVHRIAKAYPGLSIRWVVDPKWAPLLEGNPALAGTIPFPRASFGGPLGWWRFLRWTRGLRVFDTGVVLDFQGLLRSALIARLSGGGRVVGMSDAREGASCFFDETVEVDCGVHAVRRYLALADACGASGKGGEIEFLLPDGVAPGAELPERFVLLHPYSRGRGKALTPGQRQRFCEALAPVPVVIVGVAAMEDCGELPENAIDMSNKTSLLELLWLMRRASFTASVDSGPMHLAAAVTGKLLGIHTWTDPRVVGPFEPEAWVWKAGAIRLVRDLGEEDEALLENRAAKVSELCDEDVSVMAEFVGSKLC